MGKGQGEKEIVGAEMDAFIGSVDQEEREFLNPSTVLRHLCNQLEIAYGDVLDCTSPGFSTFGTARKGLE